MIPVFECLEGACALGIAWDPEYLAAFLAWWMPFNLLSYLAMLALVPLVISGAEWKEEVFSLRRIPLMTVLFWPDLLGRVTYVLLTHRSYKRKQRARAKAAFEDF